MSRESALGPGEAGRRRHVTPAEATPPPTPAVAVALAEAQNGVLSLDQLRQAGFGEDRVRRWVEAGWLVRVHRGVFSLSGARTWPARWRAAVLASRGVLSHASAAALWRIRRPRDGPIDVTVSAATGRSHRPGIKVHRSAVLTDTDVRLRDGIPVTRPARTIIDLAGSGVPGRELERAVDEAERRRLCRADDLERELSRNPRRPGCAKVRDLLIHHELGSTVTRSELEERFLALCRERKLPEPGVNARLMGLTVDFLWPRVGLIVEVDGRGGHDTARAFQDDRDRDSLLAAAGYRVLRFTWWDVTRRPGIVADRVRRVLEAR